MEQKKTFAQYFLPIYDRKIQSGEITFSKSGINKSNLSFQIIHTAILLLIEWVTIVRRTAFDNVCNINL